MKVFLILVGLVIAVYSLDEKDRVHGENGWNIPNRLGIMTWVDLPVAEENLANANVSEPNGVNEPVTFNLFTRLNPLISQNITPSTIQSSRFDRRNPTRFIIHGWQGWYNDIGMRNIINAWLVKGSFNVISVDWPRARDKNLYVSVRVLPDVGKRVGEFIKTLNQNYGMSLDTLHVIGHGLGAHIAGYTGKTVGEERIGTVVGLDPGLPLSRFDRPKERLSSTDGKFVEVFHTNAGNLGYLKPIGKRDFYLNGGKRQPICGIDPNGICSHNYVSIYYGHIVKWGSFIAVKCTTYQNAVDNRCGIRINIITLGVKHDNPDLNQGSFHVLKLI